MWAHISQSCHDVGDRTTGGGWVGNRGACGPCACQPSSAAGGGNGSCGGSLTEAGGTLGSGAPWLLLLGCTPLLGCTTGRCAVAGALISGSCTLAGVWTCIDGICGGAGGLIAGACAVTGVCAGADGIHGVLADACALGAGIAGGVAGGGADGGA